MAPKFHSDGWARDGEVKWSGEQQKNLHFAVIGMKSDCDA